MPWISNPYFGTRNVPSLDEALATAARRNVDAMQIQRVSVPALNQQSLFNAIQSYGDYDRLPVVTYNPWLDRYE